MCRRDVARCIALGAALALAACASPSPGGDGGTDLGTPRDAAGSRDLAAPPGDLAPAADLASNGTCAGRVPLVYNAVEDRTARPPPAPPALGPAGSIVTDPDFGTRILRVTDAMTNPNQPNKSWLVDNNLWTNTWNTDATIFCIGGLTCYDFDPKTMTATAQNQHIPVYQGGFSITDPHLYYGKGTGFHVSQYDFSTKTATDLVALDAIVPGVTGYIVNVSASANDVLAANFGGIQGTSPYVVAYDKAAGTHHLLDTLRSLVDGQPTQPTLGCYTNNNMIDRSGRYVTITLSPGPADGGAGNCANPILWDTQTGGITILKNGGIGEQGYGESLQRGGAKGEAFQWFLRPLGQPATMETVLEPLALPAETDIGVFSSWNNALAAPHPPIVAASLRHPTNMAPYRAWDDEIIAVSLDQAGAGDGGAPTRVWRFAHNFATYSGTIYSDDYYYLFRTYVSQNGWFAVFSSDWGGTLGNDPSGKLRRDAFVVELPNPCGP